MPSPASLPGDIAALKALIAERDAALAQRDVALAQRDTVVNELREQLSTCAAEIEHLKLWIAKLQRMQFGRKSEKLDTQIAQLELRLEDLQADEGQSASAAQRQKRPLRIPQRKPLPHICRAMSRSICLPSRLARPAAATSSSWARMCPNSWNTCRQASV